MKRIVVYVSVAAPLCAALVVALVLSIGGVTGAGPYRPDPPRNPAEALALNDPATAVWMFRTGFDPSRVYDIRPGLPTNQSGMSMRPLTAAAFTAEDWQIALARKWGATLPEDEARDMACWLLSRGREPAARMVAPPGWTTAACRETAGSQ